MALNKLTTKHLADDTIQSAKIADGAITDAKISESTTIPLSKTNATGTQPTISGLSISQKSPSVAANVTITGTSFVSIPSVQFINQSTGARITASTVTYTSSTSLTASFPAGQAIASYKVYVENPGGLAVQSTTTIINSDAPTWQTSSPLTTYEEGDTVNETLLAYDDDSTAVTGYTLQSGTLPSGVTLSGDSTIGSLTGTAPTVSADTQYNFTIRATDNESQTTDKAFAMTIADYNIGNTLLFNDDDSAYLNRTPSSAGNRKTWTWSGWVKRGNISLSSPTTLFASGSDSANPRGIIDFDNTDQLRFGVNDGSWYTASTTALFRDPSAWYHIVAKVDFSNATQSDRVKLYVNGVLQTTNSVSWPSTDQVFNNNVSHQLGRNQLDGSHYLDGYMAEVHFIDGQALDPTSFGETNSDGVWIPKKYTGSYGTNGFLLEFDSSGSLGTDTSGNGNNFTANNLAATDQMQDSPHLNYCTLNPLDNDSNTTFSEGNLKSVTGVTERTPYYATFGLTEGKWYWEINCINNVDTGYGMLGISGSYNTAAEPLGNNLYDYAYRPDSGAIFNNATSNSYGNSFADNDIIGVALDLDNNKLYFSKNGTWQNSGDPTNGTNGYSITAALNTEKGHYSPAGSDFWVGGSVTVGFNFGSPFYSISSGNSDANGYGNFEYSVPTGFYALNSKNLATYG